MSHESDRRKEVLAQMGLTYDDGVREAHEQAQVRIATLEDALRNFMDDVRRWNTSDPMPDMGGKPAPLRFPQLEVYVKRADRALAEDGGCCSTPDIIDDGHSMERICRNCGKYQPTQPAEGGMPDMGMACQPTLICERCEGRTAITQNGLCFACVDAQPERELLRYMIDRETASQGSAPPTDRPPEYAQACADAEGSAPPTNEELKGGDADDARSERVPAAKEHVTSGVGSDRDVGVAASEGAARGSASAESLGQPPMTAEGSAPPLARQRLYASGRRIDELQAQASRMEARFHTERDLVMQLRAEVERLTEAEAIASRAYAQEHAEVERLKSEMRGMKARLEAEVARLRAFVKAFDALYDGAPYNAMLQAREALDAGEE